jgi:hypothetical protein
MCDERIEEEWPYAKDNLFNNQRHKMKNERELDLTTIATTTRFDVAERSPQVARKLTRLLFNLISIVREYHQVNLPNCGILLVAV